MSALGGTSPACDDQTEHFVFGGFGDGKGADDFALAQDGDSVTDFKDLLHPVADDDDRDALVAKVRDEFEEPAGSVRGRDWPSARP